MYEPDLELSAIIRRAARDIALEPPPLNLRPQLSTTAINLSKISAANVHSQACIQSLSLQALENNLDLKIVKDVCTILAHLWDDLVDDFDETPENISGKDKTTFAGFQKNLGNGAKRFGENRDFCIYNKRAETGDRTAADELLVVAVYLLEGLHRPARALYPSQGNGVLPKFSKLDDVVGKCQELAWKALKNLGKRLRKTANAEDLMFELINIMKCTVGVLENHPKYKLPDLMVRPRAVTMPETDCEKQVKALNEAMADIKDTVTIFQSEDCRSKWKVESYGKDAGSDETAVKALTFQASDMKDRLYLGIRKMAYDETILDVDSTIKCVAGFRYEIVSLQLQLFQRLRPMNEACFATCLLAPNSAITAVGDWQLKRSFIFWCRTCESEITWSGVDERPDVVHGQLEWKCTSISKYMAVHECYAVAHHLPAVDRSGFLGSGGRWKGKGEASLYCGYCCDWQAGTPVDPQFVFGRVEDLYDHLHKMHDNEKDEGCCIIL